MERISETQTPSPQNTALDFYELIQVVRTHVRWWAIPAVVCAVLAAAYSVIAQRNWEATQALIIRPEAASVSDERTGRFADLSEMKTLQETILELAKSQSVVVESLRQVGPPHGYGRPAQWPTPLDVEEFRECLDMRPPGGAEFGKTEVFYLSVQDADRQRASKLVAALCSELEQRMQEIRDQRAQGMVAELERTVSMADGDLAKQTEQLSAFEARIGADLAELRNLNAEIGGQGAISQELQSIEAERRANDALRQENVRLLKLLVAAHADQHQLLATPNSLLKSQPSVAQLKQALVAVELEMASLLGSRSEKHPFVVAAREAEQVIRQQLHEEISVAIRGLQVDIELNQDREVTLAAKSREARQRLAGLAESRAEYSKLAASVANHTRLVEAARTNLADARARQAGARSACVISRIDGVEAGVRPIGLARKTVTAAGGASGLLIGFGLVFLFANPPVKPKSNDGSLAATIGGAEPANHHQSNCHVNVDINGNANGMRHPELTAATVGFGTASNFGIFRGMSLEEAIRDVERKQHNRRRS